MKGFNKMRIRQQKPETLETLMAAAQRGDQNAYRMLLNRIVPIIRKIVRERWYGNEHFQEDIVQDILLAFHKARHTYDPDKPFRPWLYAICRYRIVEAARIFKRKYSRESPQETSFFETFQTDGTNGSHDGLENRDLIEKALNRLPDKQRQAVVMVKLEGLSMAEAAKKAGISLTNMKVTAHRAYKSLKAILEGDLK